MFTVQDCEDLRRQIKLVADDCAAMKAAVMLPSSNDEAMANLVLAYRHLEDASMRLGKAIQALDHGISVYDRTQVPA